MGADVSSRSMSAEDSKSSSAYRHCARLTNHQNLQGDIDREYIPTRKIVNGELILK